MKTTDLILVPCTIDVMSPKETMVSYLVWKLFTLPYEKLPQLAPLVRSINEPLVPLEIPDSIAPDLKCDLEGFKDFLWNYQLGSMFTHNEITNIERLGLSTSATIPVIREALLADDSSYAFIDYLTVLITTLANRSYDEDDHHEVIRLIITFVLRDDPTEITLTDEVLSEYQPVYHEIIKARGVFTLKTAAALRLYTTKTFLRKTQSHFVFSTQRS